MHEFGLYLPNKYTDIVLRTAVVGEGEDAGAHCDFVADLNESCAEQVVAPCCLISIALMIQRETLAIEIDLERTNRTHAEGFDRRNKCLLTVQ